MTSGYYSLIQYCPDRSRMETVNVGVVLICPVTRYVGVRTIVVKPTADSGTAMPWIPPGQFSGTGYYNDMLAALLSMEYRINSDRHRLCTYGGLQAFAASRGNDLLVTEPRPIRFDRPDTELERLFDELVLPRANDVDQAVFLVAKNTSH